jgi:methyl-accepting chemotaxis protein
MFTAYSDNIEQLIGLIAGLAGSTSNAGLLRDAVALLNLQCRRNLPDASVASSMAYWGVAVLTSQPCCRLPACRPATSLRQPVALVATGQIAGIAAGRPVCRGRCCTGHAPANDVRPLGQPLGVAPALWFKTASAQMANLKKLQDALLQQLDDNVQQPAVPGRFQLWFTLLGSAATILLLSVLGWAIYHSVERLFPGWSS